MITNGKVNSNLEINTKEGNSSRKRIPLIIEAINNCNENEKFNRHAICENLAEIMVEKYKGNNLEYQSKRMGLSTSKDMLEAIDLFFYKYFKVSTFNSLI